MSSPKAQFIVPLNHFAEMLQVAMDDLRVKHKVPFLQGPLTNGQAYEIVYAMFKRNLEDRMHWVTSTGNPWWVDAHEAIRQQIPDWVPEADQKHENEDIRAYFDAVYTDVLDPIELMIENMIGQQMGIDDGTWDMWTLTRRVHYLFQPGFEEQPVWVPDRHTPLGGHTVVQRLEKVDRVVDRIDVRVANEGDFRIYEWTQNVRSGKWKSEGHNTAAHAVAPDRSFREANRVSVAEARKSARECTTTTLGK